MQQELAENTNQITCLLDIELQSDVQQSQQESSNTTEQINVTFDDEKAGENVDLKSTIDHENIHIPPNLDVSKFLERPVKIYTRNWELGTDNTTFINPWILYCNHPSIKRKLDNYYLFRANLNIKVVVNASPFYYGAMMVSYKPMKDHFASAPIRDAGPLQFDNVPYSQLPRVYIYPQNSQGGEMQLPVSGGR